MAANGVWPVAGIERDSGRMTPQTCVCLYCNITFSPDCLPVVIAPATSELGVVGWCEHCNPKLTLGTKLGIITEIVAMWRRSTPGEWDYDTIESECHKQVERGIYA